jgi:hypothetical protein
MVSPCPQPPDTFEIRNPQSEIQCDGEIVTKVPSASGRIPA